jgi:hypothetical protein
MGAAAAFFLLGMDTALQAPMPNGEFRTAYDAGKLLDGVPLTHLLSLNQDEEQLFDFVEAFLE